MTINATKAHQRVGSKFVSNKFGFSSSVFLTPKSEDIV